MMFDKDISLKPAHFSQNYHKCSLITAKRSRNLFSVPIYNRLTLTLDEKVTL